MSIYFFKIIYILRLYHVTSGALAMEYRHKVMRGTVGVIINKAIRDIRSDPKRSIRNLADLGDNFSTSETQKRFFSIARGVLKNPDNPYNKLIVDMIENVTPESVRTMSLNFGYTALIYGANTIRQREAALGRYIPWLLVFDFSTAQGAALGIERASALIAQAVSLGIYTFVFQINFYGEALESLLKLCASYPECAFFAAVSAGVLLGPMQKQVMKTPNLVILVDAADSAAEETRDRAFHVLRCARCFYGFYAYYTEESVQWLMSDEFTQKMIQNGCLIGGYVNADPSAENLENQVYRFVCAKRGRKGAPLFALDFYRDISYIGNAISSGEFLRVGNDGRLLDSPISVNGEILPELIKI